MKVYISTPNNFDANKALKIHLRELDGKCKDQYITGEYFLNIIIVVNPSAIHGLTKLK